MNFSKPVDVYSKDGVLKTTLVADYKIGKVDNKTTTGMVYNGSLVGPALHLYPGDTLELDLVNNLNESTNLHFHGVHASPANNSDNIFLEVEPGKTQHYTVKFQKITIQARYGIIHICICFLMDKFREVCLACLLSKV